MLKFDGVDELKELNENIKLEKEINVILKNAQNLNDLLYPTGYKGIIPNPIVEYINSILKAPKLAYEIESYKIKLEKLDKNKKSMELSDYQKKRNDIYNKLLALQTASKKVVKSYQDNEKYIEEVIDGLQSNKDKSKVDNYLYKIDINKSKIFEKLSKQVNKEKVDAQYTDEERKNIKSKLKNGFAKTRNAVVNVKDKAKNAYENGVGKVKDAKILDKLKNGFAKVRNKVVAVTNKVMNTKVGKKLKSGYQKIRKGVVHVKDFACKHKKAILITLAVAGTAMMIGSNLALGTPLAIPARIVSALWHPLHHIGLGGPLHSINEFLVEKLAHGSFDVASGLWTVGDKAINNMSIFNKIGSWGVTLELLRMAGYGVYKLGKHIYNKHKAKNIDLEDPKALEAGKKDEGLSNTPPQVGALPEGYPNLTKEQEEYLRNNPAGPIPVGISQNNEKLNEENIDEKINEIDNIIDNMLANQDKEVTHNQVITINGTNYACSNIEQAIKIKAELENYKNELGGMKR